MFAYFTRIHAVMVVSTPHTISLGMQALTHCSNGQCFQNNKSQCGDNFNCFTFGSCILRRHPDPIPVAVVCEESPIMDFALTSYFVETPFSSLTKHSPDLFHGIAALLIYESVIVRIDYCNSV